MLPISTASGISILVTQLLANPLYQHVLNLFLLFSLLVLQWGYDDIVLQVEESNLVARTLYKVSD